MRAVTCDMKIPSILLLLTALTLHAQDALELEEAQKIARKLVETLGTPADAPFAVDADVDKPQGLKSNKAGLVVLPDRKLNAETLGAAGTALTPIGELWLHKIVLSADGKATASDKQRVVNVTDNDKTTDVLLYLLGTAKNDKGALELVLFGRGKEALLRVPLEKRELAKQEFPIVVSATKSGEHSATLFVRLFGQYEAQLAVMKADE